MYNQQLQLSEHNAILMKLFKKIDRASCKDILPILKLTKKANESLGFRLKKFIFAFDRIICIRSENKRSDEDKL